MTLTKKHFKAIAEIINESGRFEDGNIRARRIGYSLSEYFATINPRFDMEKFLEACGL